MLVNYARIVVAVFMLFCLFMSTLSISRNKAVPAIFWVCYAIFFQVALHN